MDSLMTQEEQKQFDRLQAQLDSARQRADEVRSYFSNAVEQLAQEARLYRGLFWALLGFALAAIVIDLLRK
jgi:hypothetical protein